jgi:uncharacterized protein YegL
MASVSVLAPSTGVSDPTSAARLPVYFLLDCSSSMQGEPLYALRAGLDQFRDQVEANVDARELVYVRVIRFADTADSLTSQVPIDRFMPGSLALEANGATRLDLALSLLQQAMVEDVLARGRNAAADGQPLIFVFTDGSPTNELGYASADWKPMHHALLNPAPGLPKPSTIVAVGCGPNVTDDTLRDISTGAFLRAGTTPASFSDAIRFISASVISAVGVIARALADAQAAATRADDSASTAKDQANVATGQAGVARVQATSAQDSAGRAQDSAGHAKGDAIQAGASAEAATSQADTALTHATAADDAALQARDSATSARYEADRAGVSAGAAAASAQAAEQYAQTAEAAARIAGAEAGVAEESAEEAVEAAAEPRNRQARARPGARRKRPQ